ncbi:MAG TPA: serine/threonine-protein kinase, partial [Longimicrobium sp.]|nr:serine/threonine-protein kinase [Longimicrobium sp.]
MAPLKPEGPRLDPLPSKRDDWSPIGQMMGAYRVVRRIGKGRMSTVFLGEHTLIGSHVAIKLLHPHLAVDSWMVARFYAEARALSLAAHENIVTVLDTGAAGPNQHYLTMEYLDGRPLTALAAAAPLSPSVAIPILAQICDALGSGHARGLVHRDLRPENIILIRRAGNDHVVKLLDFGTAALTHVAAPEPQSVDFRVDLHGVGALAYQLLTGRSALNDFDGETLRSLPHELHPELPQPLARVLERALASRAEDSFGSALELRSALLGLLAVEPARPPLPRVSRDASPTLPGDGPDVAPRTPGKPHPASLKPGATNFPTIHEEETPPTPSPTPRKGSGPVLEARFTAPDGTDLGTLRCIDLSKGGLFACSEGPLPPMMARLKVAARVGEGRELACAAEVVRHVDEGLARAWGMPSGFGVQFVQPSPAFRELVTCLVEGKPLPKDRPALAARDDASSEAVLAEVLALSPVDPYAFLGLPKDVSIADVRQRAREYQRRLEALRERPLSSAQLGKLQTCLERVIWALSTLGQVEARLDHDARISNHAGIARCLATGLRQGDLDAARKRFLAVHRSAETKGMVHALTA